MDSEAAQLNALRQACELIYKRLIDVHVLNDQQVRAMSMKLLRPLGLEMDSLIPYLNKFTIVADDKYYRLDLDTPEETSARNLIIELLMRAERNQFKKSALLKEVSLGLRVQNVAGVDEETI